MLLTIGVMGAGSIGCYVAALTESGFETELPTDIRAKHLTRGRPTEVDFLNGEIVALAKTCGARAPLNERIVAMVHAAEREKKGSPGLSPDALWAALQP